MVSVVVNDGNDLDPAFTSIDDFIESLIPEVAQALSVTVPDTFLTTNAQAINDINVLCDDNIDQEIVDLNMVPIGDLSPEPTMMTRQCVRSGSTSSAISSPPLSPIYQTPVLTIEEQNYNQENFNPWEQKNCDKKYRYDPKPLMKKNRRQLVPAEEKTQKYWQRRQRNNKAARKSREDRRQKELEVLHNMNVLQEENYKLKVYMNSVLKANEELQLDLLRMRQQLVQAGVFTATLQC